LPGAESLPESAAADTAALKRLALPALSDGDGNVVIPRRRLTGLPILSIRFTEHRFYLECCYSLRDWQLMLIILILDFNPAGISFSE
jgi:hypothetical protein